MCGLTGIWSRSGRAEPDDLRATVRRMSAALSHRGPDDDGEWIDVDAGLALGFRRLSIVDLSATGHQPMVSASGRFVIAFNGEIYNHRDLRRALCAAGIGFRGTSDTEVMLEGFAHWGIEATLRRLNGMFAIALWDISERRLHLMRDPLGIKPLYWALSGDEFIFGSELKALRARPGFSPPVDRNAMAAFLRLAYVPAPHCIYAGVRKLEPGCHLTLSADGDARIDRYWDISEIAAEGLRQPLSASDAGAVDELDALLRDAIARQMVADVPLGAFLSGGIDSSTVVALMQAQSTRPVRTFTIGFREAAYNEAEHARRVAAHLGTEHTEVTIEPDHARAAIPRLADIYDEPFADSSQLPTLLLSEITRRSVTVALSGDGGDELFAGYDRYALAEAAWRRISRVPAVLRPALRGALRLSAHPAFRGALALAPAALGRSLTGGRLEKLARALDAAKPDALYAAIVSQWSDPAALLPGVLEAPHAVIDGKARSNVAEFAARMRLVDLQSYLPDDILTKVDRASMAMSLEARVPLLDTRVVALAWRLPRHQLVRAGETKWLLRRVLDRYVPRDLTERPKMGFAVPIGDWLRGPLRDWAEDLLSERALAASGLVAAPIRGRWHQHRAGKQNWDYPLWTVLTLQAWLRRWG